MATIAADTSTVDPSSSIDSSARIVCRELRIEEGVHIGANVKLLGTRIHLAAGAQIRDGAQVTAIEELTLGPRSVLGPGFRGSARALRIGGAFWSTSRVLVGGGGWQGPDSILTVGDGTSFFDGSFVNVSEHVDIGDGCALSADTTVLTHGCWQPVLDGYSSQFAPVVMESDVVVFVKSVVLPGVTLHRGTTVAAGSVVTKSTPPYSLVGGVPARVIGVDARRPMTEESRLELVRTIVERWTETLEWKGLQLVGGSTSDGEWAVVRQGSVERLRLHSVTGRPVLTVTADAGEVDRLDLGAMRCEGPGSAISEDLRDWLRRNGIKIISATRPYRPLPPAMLAALTELDRQTGAKGF
jgi:acetyltransferase-like isoleucine patch superfamily enzyme